MTLLIEIIENNDPTAFKTEVNTFLATLNPKNVLDIFIEMEVIGKYGAEKFYSATIFYKT